MRRAIVTAVLMGLLAGATVAPAEAGKKKKKKPPPPVTFETDGSLLIANPNDYNLGASVVRNEFVTTCAIPVTQGFDGYVFELDEPIKGVISNVALTGTDASGEYDLDMYFFNDTCTQVGEVSEEGTDEFGVMPAGVTYVLVTAFLGVEISFNFKAVELR